MLIGRICHGYPILGAWGGATYSDPLPSFVFLRSLTLPSTLQFQQVKEKLIRKPEAIGIKEITNPQKSVSNYCTFLDVSHNQPCCRVQGKLGGDPHCWVCHFWHSPSCVVRPTLLGDIASGVVLPVWGDPHCWVVLLLA